jgi:hypothetical protein
MAANSTENLREVAARLNARTDMGRATVAADYGLALVDGVYYAPADAPVVNWTVLPDDFGIGWASANARDLIRIACTFGNFSAAEVIPAVIARSTSRTVNTRTVEAVLAEITTAHRAAHPELYR